MTFLPISAGRRFDSSSTAKVVSFSANSSSSIALKPLPKRMAYSRMPMTELWFYT